MSENEKSAAKPKRERKPPKVYRVVSIRLTPEEHEKVASAAETAGRKTATWVRERAVEACQ